MRAVLVTATHAQPDDLLPQRGMPRSPKNATEPKRVRLFTSFNAVDLHVFMFLGQPAAAEDEETARLSKLVRWNYAVQDSKFGVASIARDAPASHAPFTTLTIGVQTNSKVFLIYGRDGSRVSTPPPALYFACLASTSAFPMPDAFTNISHRQFKEAIKDFKQAHWNGAR